MTFPSADFGGHTVAVSDLTRWQGQPLIAFLGVATEGSFIHDVFPAWADVLGIDWALRGVDLPLTAGPAAYRSLLTALHTTTAIAGAVVTNHKLPVYASGKNLFVGTDLFATVAREVNAISSSHGLRGYARDPLSLTLILPSVLDQHPVGWCASAREERQRRCSSRMRLTRISPSFSAGFCRVSHDLT